MRPVLVDSNVIIDIAFPAFAKLRNQPERLRAQLVSFTNLNLITVIAQAGPRAPDLDAVPVLEHRLRQRLDRSTLLIVQGQEAQDEPGHQPDDEHSLAAIRRHDRDEDDRHRPGGTAHLQVAAAEHDAVSLDLARRRHQPHHRERGHALATAGLADQAHRAAARHRKAHTVDGPEQAAIRRKMGFQTADLEQIFHQNE